MMKLNWGAGIAMAFTLFAAGMMFLVWMCVQQPQDLVSADYYNKELAFQQQIDHASNAGKLSTPVEFTYNAADQSAMISFPQEFNYQSISGTLHFFKPDNAALDFQLPVHPDSTLKQMVPVADLKKGLWHIKVEWKSGEKSFYKEGSVVFR